jgi:general nucleoside transport system permease protein
MMTTNSIEKQPKKVFRSRILPGILVIFFALLIFLLFGLDTIAGQKATFGLNPSYDTQALPVPDLVLPVRTSIYVLILITVFLGAYQMARGIRSTGLLVGIVGVTFVMSFLLWATQDKSFSLIGMLNSSLVRATPIALAALCGVISERSAVINIGIEGTLLFSAQAAVISATLTHSLYVGLFAAILVGGIIGAFLAVLSIRFKVNQIISGTAINILAVGTTSFISSRFLEKNIDLLNNSGTFRIIPIPLLAKIPVLGPMLFENNIIVYLMLLLVVLMHIVLFYTPWGLRTRAVGEHPKAADTLGINVFLTRYVNVIIGGMIAGVGGAYFTIGAVGRFDEMMTAGKGFIGLAAMIFGKWSPLGALSSSIIFGFADSLQVKMQILQVPIASEFLLMAPYILTMIVLAGVVGRAMPPAADGEVYEKN